MFNKSFYPTPITLAQRMIGKITGCPQRILEPSAGKGDLIEALQQSYKHKNSDISAIEIEPDLQALLRGKEIKVIDSDFLAFTGQDKFDLIFANFPFDEGEKHLQKALDILYRGQIVCLVNSETIKNPYSNDRKQLVSRLEELHASIEYIPNAFITAERRTGVEVALISVTIERNVEDDLFSGCDDYAARYHGEFTEKHEVSTGKTVAELVLQYDEVIKAGTETIIEYFKNYRKINRYIGLNKEAGAYTSSTDKDLTAKMQGAVNGLLKSARADFWRRTLDLKEVRERLTQKKAAEFNNQLTQRACMDFTESNIRQFVLNIIGNYEQTLTEAVLDIFEIFTQKHCWHGDIHEKNIHYFNGWKTNKAFKVGNRVVIPIRASYGNAFIGYSGWQLDYSASTFLDDIDKVMSYFDGGVNYLKMSDAIKEAFKTGENSGIESTYFIAKCHKKGTIHLTFKNMDILRRFNVVACRGKNWLPGDFGAKSYQQMNPQEKAVVDSFEGEKSYSVNRQKALFCDSGLLQIGDMAK